MRSPQKISSVFFFFLVILSGPVLRAQLLVPDANGIIYVKENGEGNGSSWINATGNLQKAIGEAGVKQVWVAAGTYQPAAGNSFVMKMDVAIYGGFPDNGNPGMDQRNWEQNETILLGNNNGVVMNVRNKLTNTAVLDGFIITGGRATGSGAGGGGITNVESSPTLRNLRITGNATTLYGGGIYNTGTAAGSSGGGNPGSSPRLINVLISGNTAAYGGGIGNNKKSNPTLTNVQITGNIARDGGGIYNYESSPNLYDVKIKGNKADNGGGIYNNTLSSITIINSLITNNVALKGGGAMACMAAGTGGVLTNVTIANNSTHAPAGEIPVEGVLLSDFAAAATWNNCIIWDIISAQPTTYTATNSLLQGKSNLSGDEVFVNLSDGDYGLRPGCPAINAGKNSLFIGLDNLTKDLAGNPRLFGLSIDIGAYEYQGAEALPVSFGSLSAVFKRDRLFVNWSTESESANDHFLIQVSGNGEDFQTVEKIQSKAAGGNSRQVLEYSIAIPLATRLGLVVGFLSLGVIAGSRCKYILAAACLILCAFSFSCTKSDMDESMKEGTLFVRIVQVDKDGKKSISKIVKVVNGG